MVDELIGHARFVSCPEISASASHILILEGTVSYAIARILHPRAIVKLETEQ